MVLKKLDGPEFVNAEVLSRSSDLSLANFSALG